MEDISSSSTKPVTEIEPSDKEPYVIVPLAVILPEAVICPAGPSICTVELPNCALLANIVALELIGPEAVICPLGPSIEIEGKPDVVPPFINFLANIVPEALIWLDAVTGLLRDIPT